MKKLVFMMLCGLAAFVAFKVSTHEGPGAANYREFARLVGLEQYDQAAEFAGPSVAESMMSMHKKDHRNVGLKLPGGHVSASKLRDEIAGQVGSVRIRIIDEESSEDGESIVAIMRQCRDLPGCAGARCTTCTEYEHRVEMCNDDGDWYVCDFEQEKLEEDET